MRKLFRCPEHAPACLSQYRHGTHSWGQVCEECKQDIRIALKQMQGPYCAYCEGILSNKDNKADIEHFYKRHTHETLTFDWNNLFAACGSEKDKYCAGYKDKHGGDLSTVQLIKPDIDDPVDYLSCSLQGRISIRAGLDDARQIKARQTIEVFNLNHSSLVARRKTYIKAARQTVQPIFDDPAIKHNPDGLRNTVQTLIEGYPYMTWITALLLSA